VISLDTNVILAFMYGRARREERALLEENPWAMSDAVLWEIGLLERAQRIEPVLATPVFDRLLQRTAVYASTSQSPAHCVGSTSAATQQTQSSPPPAWCTTSVAHAR
jgi:PIN domain nuclease of toxin-antitoxin system